MREPDVPLTHLLKLASTGGRDALDRVFATLYPELRRLAHARLRSQGRVVHLDTTALVHESFLRLADAQALSLTDRRHFFTYAAKVMRSIIVDFAREQLAQRRGGSTSVLQLTASGVNELGGGDDEVLMRVNDALLALEAVDPALSQLVEMRFFAGYTEDEMAELLDLSGRTIRRQWEKARAFLVATIQE